MADTTTPNYNLVKPEIGGSNDTWGNKLNENLDAIDAQMKANADAAASSIKADGSVAFTGNANLGGNKLINVANATTDSDGLNYGQLLSAFVTKLIAGSLKATPAVGDAMLVSDSEAANAPRRITIQSIRDIFKAYFDTVYAPVARTVSAGGLATGGGDLSANRTITVTGASQAEATAGTDNTKAMTPLRTKQAIDTFSPAVIDIHTFTANGTWTKPANAKTVHVRLWGAGGGGTLGSGGSGGAYGEAWLSATMLGSTQAVVVGTSASNTDGGDSTFAGLIAGGGARTAGVPGMTNCPSGETGGQGYTSTSGGQNRVFAGAGGGNGAGTGQSIFGGNMGQAPGGGGDTGGSAGGRGQVIITTFF